MTDRPILIGMNNPLSDEPAHALYPHPPGCTGHRILEMLQSVSSVTRGQYLTTFERHNLVTGQQWSVHRGRQGAALLWPVLEGRRWVAILGREGAKALDLEGPWLQWQETLLGTRYCLIPHPSGRNYWYNDTSNRQAVARRLQDMYLATKEQN